MTQQKSLRGCPRCGAHKGFACGPQVLDCPQREPLDPLAELDLMPFVPPVIPSDE